MATISNIDIGATNITTLGTITTGTWSATVPIALAGSGTGANLTADNGAILYSGASALALLAHVTTTGRLLVSGASAAPSWATLVYPTSSLAVGIIDANNANTLNVVTAANAGSLLVGNTLTPVWLQLTNGQIAALNATTFSAISITTIAARGITVTNGAGSITLNTPTIVNQNSSNITIGNQTMYMVNNGASLVTFTLPTGTINSSVIIIGASSGGWKITQNATVKIELPNGVVTTTGTGGSISSTSQYDCIRLRGTLTSTTYVAEWVSGNVIYV